MNLPCTNLKEPQLEPVGGEDGPENPKSSVLKGLTDCSVELKWPAIALSKLTEQPEVQRSPLKGPMEAWNCSNTPSGSRPCRSARRCTQLSDIDTFRLVSGNMDAPLGHFLEDEQTLLDDHDGLAMANELRGLGGDSGLAGREVADEVV